MIVPLEEQVRALAAGRAYVDLSGWHLTEARGRDARGWLNDLVTAEVGGLGRGAAVRSLLLSPTGRIRADFTVAALADAYLLVQDPRQPAAVGNLLAPYVLSSEVELEARDGTAAILAFTGGAPEMQDAETYSPSALGTGTDAVAPATDHARLREAASEFVEASAEALEAWRIRRGIPRFGADLQEESLPHEAGLDDLVAFSKGCFLGQEAVAKVRNLGRPPFVVLPFRAEAVVEAGARVFDETADVGAVTSAARDDGGTALIARVRWAARDARLRTEDGAPLAPGWTVPGDPGLR